MRIGLTGANGFLGKHCIDYWKSRHKIVGVCRNGSQQEYSKEKNVEYRVSDYSVPNLEDCFNSCECILHLAAKKVVAGEPEGVKPYLDSLQTLENVIRAALKAGITNIVTISSRCVYGTNTIEKFKESDNLSPINFYGVEKVMEEQLCQYYIEKYSLNIKVLRLSQVVGWDLSIVNSFSAFVKQALSGEDLTLYGEGVAERDYIYIEDACLGIEKALQAAEKTGIYNLGSGVGRVTRDLAEKIVGLSNSKSKILCLENCKEDTSRIVLDVSRAEKEFGFKAKYSTKEIIEDILQKNKGDFVF